MIIAIKRYFKVNHKNVMFPMLLEQCFKIKVETINTCIRKELKFHVQITSSS